MVVSVTSYLQMNKRSVLLAFGDVNLLSHEAVLTRLLSKTLVS